ncbi:MAG: tRNA uridine-5-carboxymethylaminomethyl(34) synthesis enzyme MnmG [Oscillospiraceae bacterium]|nr:tRNA uridine-5-carboxymethylaminomethyl(34) synthesis enzyme MnmG [Oscillospiraceae bacterium]
MQEYIATPLDLAVIGAGHAGIEAALAAARLGVRTGLFTINLDAVANMPCNPSIGGTAKGHLVREIDALGGQMAKTADKLIIQARMLNRGKGPAVHSPRAQVDRDAYRREMKMIVERQPGLLLRQAEIVDIRLDENGRVCSVVTSQGAVYTCRAAIIATGTYLRSKTIIGSVTRSEGPDGLQSSKRLTDCLERLGLPLRRFKTGTPARAHSSTIDFSQIEEQQGDETITPFSFETTAQLENKILCHIAYTNEDTHRVIRENIDRSPLYAGEIEGAGPRYCPNIEDKIMRFAHKPRHQIFVEPMGLDTEEIYLQGASSSFPEEIQLQFYRTIKGFSRLEIMRCAYAIEYDCLDPLSLSSTLGLTGIPGLYGAGQFCGTSGYEEAAAQGLLAGINAAHYILGRPPLTLERSSSYIGTLIDDLTLKGCEDPYRMMTSRSEYRLLLRHDNADRRLTPIGREVGLISDSRWQDFTRKAQQIAAETARAKATTIPPSEELNRLLVSRGTSSMTTGAGFAELIRRPELDYKALALADSGRPELPPEVAEQVELDIKYEGYIQKQLALAEQMKKLDRIALPDGLDFAGITALRLEAREKLTKIRPQNLGQASRISGVNPADIAVLMVYLEQR